MPWMLAAKALPWRAIGIAAAVIVGLLAVAYVVGTIKRAGMLEAQRDTALAAAAANAQIAEWQAQDHAKVLAVLEENGKVRAGTRAKADANRKAITDAPPQDDGPLAPVLRRTLDRLRGEGGPGADHGDPPAGDPRQLARP